MNRLLIGDLNINSISKKFNQLKLFAQGKADVLVVTETKLDSTFPTSQFLIEVVVNYIALIERDEVLIYVRNDNKSRLLTDHKLAHHIELNVFEVNLRKYK